MSIPPSATARQSRNCSLCDVPYELGEVYQLVYAFIRKGGLFDGVVDFDAVTFDAHSGGLKPEFVPESTTGGAGDKLHPNRACYLAMGMAIDLDLFKRGR